MQVLIAEDDLALGPLLARTFQTEKCGVAVVRDGEAALDALRTGQWSLLVLDLNLPKMDGEQVLASARQESDVPVMVLSARSTLDDRLRCLKMGADDFLSKPFSIQELLLRGKRLMRRSTDGTGGWLRCGDLEVDRMRRTVACGGRPVDLTVKEFALLTYLMEHREECVSRERLLQDVWQMHPDANTNVVDVYINYLRRKLEDGQARKLIHTVRGNGYVLRAPLPAPLPKTA